MATRGQVAVTVLVVGLLGGCASMTPNRLPATEKFEPRSPSSGDIRAAQITYPTGRFEPAWTVESAIEAHAVRAGVPAGVDATQMRSSVSPLALNPSAFTPLGPMPLNAGNEAASGRTNVIAVDPVDTTVAYAGSDGGGVWKTTNCCTAATTWSVVTDFPEIASMAIGDIVIDPNDHNTVYAGTGDLRFGSFSFGAAGLLKSSDQGTTWQVLGADVFNPYYGTTAGNFPQYQAIGKVVVDGNDSSKVIVGTKTGIFFSYDAGINWTGPCLTNPHTSQRQDTTGLIAVDEGATTRLYAAIGTRGGVTPVQPDLDQKGANGVYSTTVPASGCPASWTLLNNGWPAGTGNGVATANNVGRIELAIAPTNPQVLYAMISNGTVLTDGVLGVWRTANGGTTWVQTATPATVSGGSCPNATAGGMQMWYDAGLTVSPTNENVVIMSAVDMFRSTNGGVNFSDITCGYGSGNVHVDHHARAYIGNDPDKLLLGSDGGVWLTLNATAASPTFVPLNNTINSIEFYSGDITANFATSSTPGASGGAQDNGSNVRLWTGDPNLTNWTTRLGADGIYTRIEPVLNQRWYYSSQNGAVSRSNTTAGSPISISGAWGSDIKSFIMPFEIYRYGELDVAGSGCTSAAGCTRLIAGTTRVWETVNGATNGAGWYINSPNLPKGTLGARSFVQQLAYAMSDPAFAVVGTSDGNVWMGRGLGAGTANTATWVNVTDNNVSLPNRPIMDVVTDPIDPLIAYASIGGFNQNTPTTPGHVFRLECTSNCASFTWSDKTGNLPNIPANTIAANPHMPQQVFVGTDWGLYYTDDINVSTPVWQRHEGLPHVMIWDMAIDRGFTTLAVFTRSRGAWAWPLPIAVDPQQIFEDGFE